ncbi:MAG: DUF6913 domain-containing protein [Bacteroidales bacterium]
MGGIRENIGKRILKRKKKELRRDVQVHNFETASSAVILFPADNPGGFPAIKEFRKFLEASGIKCRAYGYVPEKEIPQEMLFWKNYSFITRNDLNWYYKPAGEAVESFYAQDPDILIDLTPDIPLELQYLVQLSTARFKIGIFTEEDNDYDLMINLKQKSDMAFLTEQIKHYVSILNHS